MNDELISREALIKKLQYVYSCDYIDSKSKEGVASDIIDEINNAPTVEAYPFEQVQELVKLNQQFAQEIENLKRPKGEWIITAEDNEGIHRIQCPFCGYEKGSDFIDYITVTFEKFPPFCENCGADLRVGDE